MIISVKKFLPFLIISVFFIVCVGCGQWRAKHWGGTMEIHLPSGQKLETVTWKDDHLWYLIRPMRPDELPENHSFRQSSRFGILEGEVVFYEHK